MAPAAGKTPAPMTDGRRSASANSIGETGPGTPGPGTPGPDTPGPDTPDRVKSPARRQRPTQPEAALRRAIIDQCLWMNATGLNQGTSGNISARYGDHMLITPSSVPYTAMTADMIAAIPIDGDGAADWKGPNRPSSEWRFHRDILCHRPEFGAVVHTHSTFATVLAMARKDIPPVHYMIAMFGGDTVRCAPYARFGSAELSANALAALKDRKACILANHGMIAAGPDLDRAMALAVELETLCRQYFHLLLIGGGVTLSPEQIAETAAAMRQLPGYGG